MSTHEDSRVAELERRCAGLEAGLREAAEDLCGGNCGATHRPSCRAARRALADHAALAALTDQQREGAVRGFCTAPGCWRALKPGERCHCTRDE